MTWKTRIRSINTTTWSVGNGGEECKPEAASKGATWTGIPNWAALTTNSSAQVARSRVNCKNYCLRKNVSNQVRNSTTSIHLDFMNFANEMTYRRMPCSSLPCPYLNRRLSIILQQKILQIGMGKFDFEFDRMK